MSRHPLDDARRQSLVLSIALAAASLRALRVFRAVGRGRQLAREMRAQHARELNNLDEHQLQRTRELTAEIVQLRAQLVDREQHPDEPAPTS